MRTRNVTLQAAALAVAAGLASTAAHAAVSTNLQGYWKLDETSNTVGTTVVNSGSVAENGSIQTIASVGNAGVVGTSYVLDDGLAGGDDASTTAKANLTPSASTIVDNLSVLLTSGGAATADTAGVNRVSMSMWIRPTSNKAPTTGASGRSQMFATNSDLQFALLNSAGPSNGSSATQADLFFNFRPTSGGNVGANTTGNAAGVHVPVGADAPWTHVAVTRDAGTVSFFVNGVMISQATGLSTDSFAQRAYENGGGTDSDYNLLLGTTNNATRDFAGGMDEAGVWVDRAVTAAEIAAIAGLGRYSNAGLDNAGIDAVLAVHTAGSGSADVNGKTWSYTTSFAAPADASTLVLGKHYTAGDTNYIILGGTEGAFTGVSAPVPEPTALGVLGVAGLGMIARRRRPQA